MYSENENVEKRGSYGRAVRTREEKKFRAKTRAPEFQSNCSPEKKLLGLAAKKMVGILMQAMVPGRKGERQHEMSKGKSQRKKKKKEERNG